jgi:hypothetical protein
MTPKERVAGSHRVRSAFATQAGPLPSQCIFLCLCIEMAGGTVENEQLWATHLKLKLIPNLFR